MAKMKVNVAKTKVNVVKMKVNIVNIKKTLRLILMMCALLSILNWMSYQDIRGNTQEELTREKLTKELAPLPTPVESVMVSHESSGASMVIMPREIVGRIIPVNMAQLFFVLIIGMTGTKLVLVMAKRIGSKAF